MLHDLDYASTTNSVASIRDRILCIALVVQILAAHGLEGSIQGCDLMLADEDMFAIATAGEQRGRCNHGVHG